MVSKFLSLDTSAAATLDMMDEIQWKMIKSLEKNSQKAVNQEDFRSQERRDVDVWANVKWLQCIVDLVARLSVFWIPLFFLVYHHDSLIAVAFSSCVTTAWTEQSLTGGLLFHHFSPLIGWHSVPRLLWRIPFQCNPCLYHRIRIAQCARSILFSILAIGEYYYERVTFIWAYPDNQPSIGYKEEHTKKIPVQFKAA